MTQTKTIYGLRPMSINLQQGFLMTDEDHIVAAYSHHTKTIYFKIPNHSNDFNIPEEFFGYAIINKRTDSFGINMWTSSGTKDLC